MTFAAGSTTRVATRPDTPLGVNLNLTSGRKPPRKSGSKVVADNQTKSRGWAPIWKERPEI